LAISYSLGVDREFTTEEEAREGLGFDARGTAHDLDGRSDLVPSRDLSLRGTPEQLKGVVLAEGTTPEREQFLGDSIESLLQPLAKADSILVGHLLGAGLQVTLEFRLT